MRPEDLQEAVNTVLGEAAEHATGSSTALMRRIARLQESRAERLDIISKRLAEALGEDHPRVIELAARRDSVLHTVDDLKDVADRRDRAREPRVNEWAAVGRVVDETDEAVPGLRVRLFDKDRIYDDLLGDEITDEAGQFHMIYHQRDFAETGEKLPELYLVIHDASGKLLFSSEDTVRPQAGRREVFAVTLTRERISKGVPRQRCEATTAKGTRCKNLAEPGSLLCQQHRRAG